MEGIRILSGIDQGRFGTKTVWSGQRSPLTGFTGKYLSRISSSVEQISLRLGAKS